MKSVFLSKMMAFIWESPLEFNLSNNTLRKKYFLNLLLLTQIVNLCICRWLYHSSEPADAINAHD